MKCPKCSSTEKIKAIQGPSEFDSIAYQLKCDACGVIWKDRKGRRVFSEKARKQQQEKWDNVKIEPSRLDYLRMKVKELKDG